MDTSETMAEASSSRDGYNREYRSSKKHVRRNVGYLAAASGIARSRQLVLASQLAMINSCDDEQAGCLDLSSEPEAALILLPSMDEKTHRAHPSSSILHDTISNPQESRVSHYFRKLGEFLGSKLRGITTLF